MDAKSTNKYDEVFMEQASLGFYRFQNRYMKTEKMKLILDRQEILNKSFVYTPDVRDKVLQFQNVYTQQFKEAIENVLSVEEFVKAKMENNKSCISDYTIDFEVHLYSPKKYSHIDEMESCPFFYFESYCLGFGEDITKSNEAFDLVLPPEFTSNTLNHPLQGIEHNYLIHELFDHTILTYSDILETEQVWIEAKLCMQKIFDL